jgi:hypothetical protein
MRDDVHACWVQPTEERLVVCLCLLDKRQGEVADLVVHCLHPFGIKRAGVLDLLFADLAPAWHHGGVVCVGRPRVDHVARADDVQQVLRVVRMSWIFHRIEVIEVAEEFVEAVDGGQKLIEIAQVVLTELTGCVALRFKGGSYRASLRWYADFGTSLADRRHASTNRKFAHDEVRATRRAAGLGVIIGEQHSLLGHLVEIGCTPGHQAAMVGTDIPHSDVITHDEQNVRFLVLSLHRRADANR